MDTVERDFDEEWIQLIWKAKNMGFSFKELKEFFNHFNQKDTLQPLLKRNLNKG